MTWRVLRGDCVLLMQSMDECSVDAICTDPPYGLEFMGKEWDRLGDIGKGKNRGMSPGRFKGMVMPESYNADANVKCANCGKWKKDHAPRKCVCATPDFPNVKAHQARLMQDWHQAWATEALRVLRPGGHLLAFGGTRTYHRLACAVEDAGFEIRDTIAWMYGSGFPKSLDVSKAIDRQAGAEREDVYEDKPREMDNEVYGKGLGVGVLQRNPATPEAQQWEGWGTAIKPSFEPVVVARKPLSGTVAQNVLEHGTGALNVDGCRIAGDEDGSRNRPPSKLGSETTYAQDEWTRNAVVQRQDTTGLGRWPANVVLSHTEDCVQVGTRKVKGHKGYPNGPKGTRRHDVGLEPGGRSAEPWPGHPDAEVPAWKCSPDCPVRLLDEQTGETKSASGPQRYVRAETTAWKERGGSFTPGREWEAEGYGDSGGASRFFYCAKSSRSERNAGLEGFEEKKPHDDAGHVHADGRCWDIPGSHSTPRANGHPTVKPISLMRWLVRLVTPPNGTVLDPFAGSGTTGIAAVLEGFDFIGMEREPEYADIAEARIRWWEKHRGEGTVEELLNAAVERDAREAEGQIGFDWEDAA